MRLALTIALIILGLLIVGLCTIAQPPRQSYYDDDTYKYRAIHFFAIAKNDSSKCSLIPGDPQECYHELAVAQKNYELCTKPARLVDQEFCTYQVSLERLEPETCLQLTNLEYYYSCITENAKAMGNETVCNLMDVKDESYPYRKKGCINEAIFGKLNVSECALINTDKGGWTQQDYIRACKENARREHATPESCEKGTSGLSVDDCWLAVAFKQPRNSSYCDFIRWQVTREHCYLNTAERSGYFCDNPPPQAASFCEKNRGKWVETNQCEKVSEEVRDKCILGLAKERQDLQKCREIKNADVLNNCEESIKEIQKKQASCGTLPGDEHDLCLFQYGLKYARSLCENIYDNEVKKICKIYSPMKVVRGL